MQLLKGQQFARRVERVCAAPVEPDDVVPLPDLKHRRILAPGMVGGERYFALVGFIAQACRMRGAEVLCLQCDAFLPACTLRKSEHHESACTRWCHRNAGPFAEAMRLPHRWYGEFITGAERRECDRAADAIEPGGIDAVEWRGIPLGEHVHRSIESYFKVGRFDPDDPAHAAKAREFLRSAMYLAVIGDRVIEQFRIDKVLMEDGKKVDWGVIRAIAGRRGIPVDVIRAGLRGHSIRFEVDRPPDAAECMPHWASWKDVPLTPDQERELDDYLARREIVADEFRGPEWHKHTSDLPTVRRLIGLPAGPSDGLILSMFPTVSFDVGSTKTRAAFDTAEAWVIETIKCLARHPRHHLVVRVHPCEARRAVADPLAEAVARHVGPLPANVHLIRPDSDITAQAVARLSDVCMVYASTVAVEAGALGKPVILVGGGWNAGRGFTCDFTSPRAYIDRIEAICAGGRPAIPEPNTTIARRYAYAQFFRVNIPVTTHGVLDHDVTDVRIETLGDLAPGNDPAMDVICRGILCDAPFEAPETLKAIAR